MRHKPRSKMRTHLNTHAPTLLAALIICLGACGEDFGGPEGEVPSEEGSALLELEKTPLSLQFAPADTQVNVRAIWNLGLGNIESDMAVDLL